MVHADLELDFLKQEKRKRATERGSGGFGRPPRVDPLRGPTLLVYRIEGLAKDPKFCKLPLQSPCRPLTQHELLLVWNKVLERPEAARFCMLRI